MKPRDAARALSSTISGSMSFEDKAPPVFRCFFRVLFFFFFGGGGVLGAFGWVWRFFFFFGGGGGGGGEG